MALAETAKLVASLELKDKFSPAANKAMQSLGKLESRAFRAGQQIGKGFKNAAHNLRNVGIVAAAGIAFEVKQGLSSLAALETATTSVTGAIKTMGQQGQVSASQVATWANEIETSVQAAFDDKDITAAAATLVRFGKVVPTNLRQSLVVMTDLAAKTGSVESASTLLAKALADPTKAAGKLARVGVILTKAQQKQIVAFEKAGKKAKAQKVLLDALAQTTKGAAAASVGEYGDALNMLEDATEDAQRALAIGFFPIIKKVSSLLSTELAKPQTLAAIRDFGETLADAFDSVLEMGRKLPWGAIASSLKVAGEGAKTLLNAFTSLPPWIQTAVLTGWGLNKLTGGVLGDVVGSLASGLIKGVLGMTAGIVNINAGVVNGPGGVPTGGVPAGGGAAAIGLLPLVGIASIAAGAAHAITEAANADLRGKGIDGKFEVPGSGILPFGIESSIRNIDTALKGLVQNDRKLNDTSISQGEKTRSAFNMQSEKEKAAIAAAANKSTTDAERIKGTITTSENSSASRIVSAIQAIPVPDIIVNATTVQKTTTISNRYGPPGGSRDTGKAAEGFGGQ